MKITVVGTGYVGLVTGACLSIFGNKVQCIDNVEEKINQLKEGKIPIYEPKLSELVRISCLNKMLKFSTSLDDSLESTDATFVCVGTPSSNEGSADLSSVMGVINQIGNLLGKKQKKYHVIILKSTVPVGTCRKAQKILEDKGLIQGVNFDIVSNPEFLREGHAVDDFLHPNRIVIGVNSKRSENVMKMIYAKAVEMKVPIVTTTLETSEISKYASNAFLATKISFINEMANICDYVKADITSVATIMGLDDRISPLFLNPGPGYGGSCFPKDVKAIIHTAKENGYSPLLLESVEEVNQKQIYIAIKKLKVLLGDGLEGACIGLLGLTFKPDTDDIRESPSIKIIELLKRFNTKIKAYDPMAKLESEDNTTVQNCNSLEDAISGVDAVIVVTEWEEFKQMDFNVFLDLVKFPNLIDLRNMFKSEDVEKYGIRYLGIGTQCLNLKKEPILEKVLVS